MMKSIIYIAFLNIISCPFCTLGMYPHVKTLINCMLGENIHQLFLFKHSRVMREVPCQTCPLFVRGVCSRRGSLSTNLRSEGPPPAHILVRCPLTPVHILNNTHSQVKTNNLPHFDLYPAFHLSDPWLRAGIWKNTHTFSVKPVSLQNLTSDLWGMRRRHMSMWNQGSGENEVLQLQTFLFSFF